MPLPTPNTGESESDFVGRCMSNATMLDEYPDEKQRAAVCHAQFDKMEDRPMTTAAGAVEGGPLTRFVPIVKIDEERREVHGILAREEVDHAGEIMDYDSSKEHFLAWSNAFKAATNGKSEGNLRAMHGTVAAGKFLSVQADDAQKSFPVVAKVVDDNEWDKTKEGVYTGFSIGGKYVKVWKDEESGLIRYTAAPIEGSLVDKPCIPGAVFTMVRRDGKVEMRKFVSVDSDLLGPAFDSFVDDAILKALTDAVAAGDDAIDAIKRMVAELVQQEGDIDTWAIEDLMVAIRNVMYARFSARAATEQEDIALSQEPEVTKDDATPDATPDEQTPAPDSTDRSDEPDPKPDDDEPNPDTDDDTPETPPADADGDEPATAKIDTAPIQAALTKMQKSLDASVKTLQDGVEQTVSKTVETAVGSVRDELTKTIQGVTERLDKIEKRPAPPGRPVSKVLGSVEVPQGVTDGLSKVEELIQTYEKTPGADANVVRELRVQAATLAANPLRP